MPPHIASIDFNSLMNPYRNCRLPQCGDVGDCEAVPRDELVSAQLAIHPFEALTLDLAVPAPFRGGDSYIAEPADCLHREQRPQVLPPGEEIVDLQQIEARYTPESARGFSPACRPSGGRNSAAAPVAAKTRSSRRRLNGDICSIATCLRFVNQS